MPDKFEQAATWYLRLNGYLTVPNFILHPQRTEADVLAVRFPYSKEVVGRNMRVDENLVLRDDKIDFIIAEVKRGRCKLNGPWTKSNTKNMHYVLKWLGMAPPKDIGKIANDLYSKKRHEAPKWTIRLACFGQKRSNALDPNVVQIKFSEVVFFMRQRFEEFKKIKADHSQWDSFIREFFCRTVDKRHSDEQLLAWLSSQGKEQA